MKELIRFKIGDKPSLKFYGTIDVTTEIKYLFEKRDPFDARKYYRHGQYFQDTLGVSIVATSKQYSDLFHAMLDKSVTKRIMWETQSGHQNRVVISQLPYPSKIRFLRGAVSFKLETEPYDTQILDMNDPEAWNLRWGEKTPRETMWN